MNMWKTSLGTGKGCAVLLMVKDPSGSLALKLLLLQDALEVLHALTRVLHVSRQVAVEEADGVAEHRHAGAHTPFVPLGHRQAHERSNNIQEKENNALLKKTFGFIFSSFNFSKLKLQQSVMERRLKSLSGL